MTDYPMPVSLKEKKRLPYAPPELHYATKEDVAKVEVQVAKLETTLKADISRVETTLKADISKVEIKVAKVETQVAKLEAKLEARVSEVRSEIVDVKSEMIKWMVGINMATICILTAIMALLK